MQLFTFHIFLGNDTKPLIVTEIAGCAAVAWEKIGRDVSDCSFVQNVISITLIETK